MEEERSASQAPVVFGFILAAAIAVAAVFAVTKGMPGSAGVAPAAVASQPKLDYVPWQASYEEAWANAYNQKKPIIMDFYTDWCPVCKKLDATYMSPDVIAESQNFVSVKINAEVRTDLARQYGVTKYPTVICLDNRGQVVDRFSGSYPPAEYTQWLQRARSNYTPIS